MTGPRNTCDDCGKPCWYTRCYTCRKRHEREYGRGVSVELTGGSWVPRHGIMRWVADPEPDLCGTDQGYYRHRSRNEQTCAECRRAHATVERQRVAS